MMRPHGQVGVETVWTFCGQGGWGQFFAILCGHSLWTAKIVGRKISKVGPTEN